MRDSIAGQLQAGRPVLINTTGKSMEPLLRQGRTQVLICPLDREPRLGDLPLVEIGPGLYRLHRIVAVRENCYVTQGDNSIGRETIELRQILGLARQIRRGKRTLSLDSRGCRFYGRLWLFLTPVRIPLYRLREAVYRVLERI